jgi:uncharacterized protein (DUF1499 family)
MKAYAEIAPIKFAGEGLAAIDRIKRIVETTEGARIIRAEPTYLYARFRTRWLKFRGRRRILSPMRAPRWFMSARRRGSGGRTSA